MTRPATGIAAAWPGPRGAVRAILTNPRYTGRQVWNRQRKDEVLLDVNDVALGHTTKMRWNQVGQWIYSDQIAHPVVIDDATFGQAQDVLAARGRGPCQHKPHPAVRGYAFAGIIFCGLCQRRMQGQRVRQDSYYRCRFPAEYALANELAHPRNVYVRESAFEADINAWLAGLFTPGRLQHTIDQITAAQGAPADGTAAHAARARIEDANRKIAGYRIAIVAGGDAAEIGQWITDAKAQRVRAENDLRIATAANRMSRRQIEELITAVTDIAAMIRDADPRQLADSYANSGCALLTSQNGR